MSKLSVQSEEKRIKHDSIVKKRWEEIKEKAFQEATPAMRLSIERSTGRAIVKTASDYRAKDGTAIRNFRDQSKSTLTKLEDKLKNQPRLSIKTAK